MTATTSNIITEQEYLELEEKVVLRHEFINGKMYEMPGENTWHEDIVMNIAFLLKQVKLKVFTHGLRVRQPDIKNYYYPDVLVLNRRIPNVTSTDIPFLIVEVLSPSTRTNDLSDKFIAYRQFATLEYYLVVESDFCYVNLFSKDANGEWQSEVFNQLSDTVQLPKLTATLTLADVYEGLDWV